MFDAVYSWITTSISFAVNTFTGLLDATGTGSFYLTGLTICVVMSFLVFPLLSKGAGSDRARRKGGDDDE